MKGHSSWPWSAYAQLIGCSVANQRPPLHVPRSHTRSQTLARSYKRPQRLSRRCWRLSHPFTVSDEHKSGRGGCSTQCADSWPRGHIKHRRLQSVRSRRAQSVGLVADSGQLVRPSNPEFRSRLGHARAGAAEVETERARPQLPGGRDVLARYVVLHTSTILKRDTRELTSWATMVYSRDGAAAVASRALAWSRAAASACAASRGIAAGRAHTAIVCARWPSPLARAIGATRTRGARVVERSTSLHRILCTASAAGNHGTDADANSRNAMAEDAVVPLASEWEAYDPSKVDIPLDPASATGAPLPHLTRFPRSGSVPASQSFVSADGTLRIQALAPRVVRVEYSPVRGADAFEDRPTFCFVQRGRVLSCDPVFGDSEPSADTPPTYSVQTDWLSIRVQPTREHGLGAGGLVARLRKRVEADDPNDDPDVFQDKSFVGADTAAAAPDDGDLLGTCRTLDEADGFKRRHWDTHESDRNVFLGNGILSRNGGLTFIDDSTRAVFTDDGWIASREQRDSDPAYFDCYIIANGADYLGALQQYTRFAGEIPMIPRRYLGNWWSRYHAYDDPEFRQLVLDFEQRVRVPLSMLIIDMDWHLVKHEDGVAPTSDGWTGYTWNKKLFPDPPGFIRWLHDRDIGTSLNLHPAGGVHSHEAAYEEFANFIGAQKLLEGRNPIPFDLTDQMSASAYFKCLLHPLEDGVGDLDKWSWWLDWQQGSASRLKTVDPLFLLNHLHFLDMARGEEKARRPVVFSRYAGPGSHRFPIGFSGDTHSTWESLAFQPFMSTTAANAAFPFWSHDIGGHTRGAKDDALYARWVQFACFSPILRLHSSNNPYCVRMPWSFGADACRTACDAMRLRHALVPYIYSCTRKTHTDSIPLMMPMYYSNPDEEDAYACPAQYWFGSELIAAPVVTPPDNETRLSRQVVWLPPTESGAPWRHGFTGEAYSGGKWHAIHASLDYVPVFAKPGAVVPMAPTMPAEGGRALSSAEFNSIQNPAEVHVSVVAGASGSFELFEDEECGQGRGFTTKISVDWNDNDGTMEITVHAPVNESGDSAQPDDVSGVLPGKRTWVFRSVGVNPSAAASVSLASANEFSPAAAIEHLPAQESIVVTVADVPVTQDVAVKIAVSDDTLLSCCDRRKERALKLLDNFNLGNEKKFVLMKRMDALVEDVGDLTDVPTLEKVTDPTGTLFTITPAMKLALVETIDGCGFARCFLSRSGAPAVAWSGSTVEVTGMLYPGHGADPPQSFNLESASRKIFWPRPAPKGAAPDRLVMKFGEVVSAALPLRDPDDTKGWPSPVVQ